MTNLSITSPMFSSALNFMPIMLKDALLRLCISGYSVLALSLRYKYKELLSLQSLTVFGLDNDSIFTGGPNYVADRNFLSLSKDLVGLVISILLLGDFSLVLLTLLLLYSISLLDFFSVLFLLPLGILLQLPAGLNALFSHGPRRSAGLTRVYALWNVTSLINVIVAFICGFVHYKHQLSPSKKHPSFQKWNLSMDLAKIAYGYGDEFFLATNPDSSGSPPKRQKGYHHLSLWWYLQPFCRIYRSQCHLTRQKLMMNYQRAYQNHSPLIHHKFRS